MIFESRKIDRHAAQLQFLWEKIEQHFQLWIFFLHTGWTSQISPIAFYLNIDIPLISLVSRNLEKSKDPIFAERRHQRRRNAQKANIR
jgi:hypothetical protein